MAEEKNSQEERLEALFTQLKEMKEENLALRKDVLRMSYVKPPASPGDDPEPAVDLKGLPDMQEDPEGWAAAYAERAQEVAEKKAARKQQKSLTEAEQRKRAEELYVKFRNDYPELAKDEDKMEIAVRKAWSRGSARGYDMDRYVYGHSDLFFEEVAEEYSKAFGAAPKAEEKDEPENTQNDAAWGIFGGSMGESSKPKAGAGKEEALGSFSADLKRFQKERGYSW